MAFAADKSIKDNMRTKTFRQPDSFRGELPRSSRDQQWQALTRLLQIYSARVERLRIAVENSEYFIPAATLSAAMLAEHLSN